jgi:hypothetical protein
MNTGAISSVVERLVYTENVGGSIPSSPTTHAPSHVPHHPLQGQLRDHLQQLDGAIL